MMYRKPTKTKGLSQDIHPSYILRATKVQVAILWASLPFCSHSCVHFSAVTLRGGRQAWGQRRLISNG